MTITDELLTDRTRRDRWGRYLVLPPGGTKPVGYTRATTIAKLLDDQGGLMNWRSRMVTLGLVQRADLYAMASTIDPDDKKALDQLCERAAEAGGATVRRDLGTAFHAILEKFWTQPDFEVPSAYKNDVHSVVDALANAGLTVVDGMNEQIVIHDRLQIAGTFDLIVEDATGNKYIADIKTGSSVTFGALAFAIQLAIYANADAIYKQGRADDGSDDQRLPMPNVDQTVGVIIHIQPGSGFCEIHQLDLTIGRDALDLAMAVRDARKLKPIIPWAKVPFETDPVDVVKAHFPDAIEIDIDEMEVSDEWRDWMRLCIKQIIDAGLKDYLKQIWPDGVPTLASGQPITKKQGQQLADVVYLIGSEALLEFFPPQPDRPNDDNEPLDRPNVKSKFDDNEMVSKTDLKELAQKVSRLDGASKRWLDKWSSSCSQRGVSIALTGDKGIPSTRRFAICEFLTTVAGFTDDDIFKSIIVKSGGDPKRSLTMQLGSMTIEHAKKSLDIAQQIIDGTLVVHYDDNGDVNLV